MVCTGTRFCIIMSYHPESTSANYILVTLHNLIWDVIKIVTNSMYHKTLIQEWPHRENVASKNIEKNISGRVPDSKLVKPLHTFINKIAKCVQQVKFE